LKRLFIRKRHWKTISICFAYHHGALNFRAINRKKINGGGGLMIKQILEMEFFKRHSGYGTIFLRLIIGTFIIYGVQDNVFSYERMQEFEKFLAARNVPSPLFAAFLSAYTQFICGVLILLGAFIRLAAVPFIINFIAALMIAHRGETFPQMILPLIMLFTGFFFLFNGAGKLSVDEWLEKRSATRSDHASDY
jgi:putative oxidoreductase